MIIPCEIASRTIVPSVRAMIAKELSESYKMRQNGIACILGVTQSAVSQYLGNVRGNTLNLENVEEIGILIQEMTNILTTNPTSNTVCRKCCEACRIIREKRVLCKFHNQLDSSYDPLSCNICIP
ncbi:MAG: hypothetical protein V1915_03950 [Candidatus Bathyarchaeota archaeon]